MNIKFPLVLIFLFFIIKSQAQDQASKIGTIFLSGVNLYSDALNIYHLSTKDYKRKSGVLGIGTGVLQMGFGLVVSDYISGGTQITHYRATNLIVGAGSILLSALNLSLNKQNFQKKNVTTFFSYPVNHSIVMGVSYKRKL